MQLFYAATAALFLLFVATWLRNKARMRVGFLFCAFLVSAALSYALFAAQQEGRFYYFSLLALGLLAAGVLFFGVYVLVGGLLLNFRVMHRRERPTMANRLTLFLALAILAVLVLGWAIGRFSPPRWVTWLWAGLLALCVFYFFHVFVFLTSALLMNLSRPRLRQDYVIVLGASLVNGEVSPLLARRVARAVRFYHKQGDRRAPPRLVMSGGRGADEASTEAAAMRRCALKLGVPGGDILLEEKSRNTYENFEYSKALIEADADGKPFRAIFATSNYHLLRSAMLARKAGLAIDGIGSKTALYYLPTALLREYAAYFWMRKRPLLVLAALVFLAGFGLALASDLILRYNVVPPTF